MFMSILSNLGPDFFKVATLRDLETINNQLVQMGLPIWFKGFLNGVEILNPHYKLYPTPRVGLTWKGLRLREVYLRPFARKDELMYSVFVNKFYAEVATEDLPEVVDGPEIKILF